MKKILLALSLLALAFSSVQACDTPCGEIKILPTSSLESCPMSESKTVEVLIYNPGDCYSNITNIALSDDVNFDLNRSFGDVPCGDASTVNMGGYQYCTVGLTFKPTTTSGTFSTDIQVTDRDTGVHSVTVDGDVKTCCHIKPHCQPKPKPVDECTKGNCEGGVTELTLQNLGTSGTIIVTEEKTGNEIFNAYVATGDTFKFDGSGDQGSMGVRVYVSVNGVQSTSIHTSCSVPVGPGVVFGDFKVIEGYSRNGGLLSGTNCSVDTTSVNYLANLNLVKPVSSTHIYVENGIIVFDKYYQEDEGLVTFALDGTVDFLSRLTFDVNRTTGFFMPRLAGNNGFYYTNTINKTNRYGFMFPSGKVMDTLNFIEWGRDGLTGTVSNLSLIEISDLNQTSTQESDANCGDDLHSFCNIDLHKICDRDHKRDSHKTCERDHKRDSHKTCERDYKRDSHKTCDRDDKRDSHKTCGRDDKRDSHKTCGRDDKRDSHKTCGRDDKRDSHKTCDRDDKRDSHKTCDRDDKRDSHKTCDRDDKRDSHKTCDRR